MRMVWVMIILLVSALLSVPFVLERYPGKYFLTFKDLQTLDNKTIVTRYQASYRRLVRELKDKDIDVPIDEKAPDRMVYKWKDKSGNWQFGDVAPEGVESELIEVVDKINTMSTDKAPNMNAE